uniref:Uncharacterized protein n=1 Tax=Strix occidentalis caurina TaxID=311401 RepID=A0A8D0KWL1_STROC
GTLGTSGTGTAWIRATGTVGWVSGAGDILGTSGVALSPSPVLRACSVPVPPHRSPVQAWVESLRHHDDERRGLTDLHPGVFAVRPRLDILHTVAMWQKNFKRI